VNQSNAMGRWHHEAIQAQHVTGRSFEVYKYTSTTPRVWVYADMHREMYGWIQDAGFEDVVEKRCKWPLGPWPKDPKLKELGIWARAHTDAGLENWCLALLTRVLGWSYEQVQVHIAAARKDLWDKSIHGIHEMRVVYGRKPPA